MENLVRFGLLTGITILCAFVADVTVGPAVMALGSSARSRSGVRAQDVDPIR
jgi:hypothetical protein